MSEDHSIAKIDTQKNSKKPILLIGGVVGIIFAGAALYFWQAGNTLEKNGYQAVFLTNGQVYFGKVANQKSTWVELTNIYYLQSRDLLQNQDRDDFSNQSDLTLVKLGQELHGPTDSMQILRDHILFIEDLAKDSKVVQAIKDYQIQR